MRRVDPNDLAWLHPSEYVRYKEVTQQNRKVTWVEFASGFSETEWCCKAHIGYVLSGRLEVAFGDSTEMFSPGDILTIAAGETDRHRARVVNGPVRIILIEDAFPES